MNPNDALKQAKDALTKAIAERKQNQDLIRSLGPAIVDALAPALEGLAENSKITKGELLKAVQGLSVNVPSINMPKPQVNVNVPDVYVTHEVKIPEIKIPKTDVHFDTSKIRIPDIKMPDEMNITGWISLMGYDRGLLTNPLPVQLRDAKGNPVSLFENMTQILSGGSGKSDFFTIKGFGTSAFAELTNPDGRLKVELPSGVSGLTDTELRASSVPVAQVSGASWSTEATINSTLDVRQVSGNIDSVYVTGIANSSFSELQNGDGRLRVSVETGGSGLTDAELRATPVPVQQVSGYIDSVSVTGFSASVGATLLGGDGASIDPRDRNWTITETVPVSVANTLDVKQVSGSSWSVFATNPVDNGDMATALRTVQAGNSVSSVYANNPVNQGDAATALRVVIAGNSDVSTSAVQSGTWNIGTVTTVTGITNTVATANVDSTGVQYSGSNPLPVTSPNTMIVNQVSGGNFSVYVTGSSGTTAVTGTVASDVADDGSPPVKNGGVARTANPTAVAAGDAVTYGADDLGRQLMRPVQVRDLTVTAYATLTNGTETTLLAASAGSLHDLIYILASNNSTVAVGVDIRPVTAGNIIMHLEIPANGVVGVSTPVPIPQSASDTGNNWTADMGDITGTTVYLSALFSREV